MKEGMELHIFMEKLPLFKTNNLMNMYVKRGSMLSARQVFDSMPKRNVVSWNIIILGYAKQDGGTQALELYARMQEEGVEPNDRTFLGALKACCSLAELEEGKQVEGKFVRIACVAKGRAIHSQVVKGGFESDAFVGTTLVALYAKCGSLDDARHVFDKLLHRDVVTWNNMILSCAEEERSPRALELYARMHKEGVQPNERTFLGALKACSSLGCLAKGRGIHSQLVGSGFDMDLFLGNILVDMYAKCGSMEDARRVFDELRCRDVVTWTSMILGYAEQEEDSALALQLYAWMHKEGIQPNDRTFVGALKACSSLAMMMEQSKQVEGKFYKMGQVAKGRAIHFQIVKSGFEFDVFVGNVLLHMYAKCGSVEDARCIFDELPQRNVVTWSTMILGYAEQEESAETFTLYAQMQEQGLPPNMFTFIAILKACSNTAALETGKELHSQICSVGFQATAMVANSLIHMYAKCGSMLDAQLLFDALPTRDVVRWNALLAGYAHQGDKELTFHYFERMRQEGIQPDSVTFLSLLTVSSHVGLVAKGQEYFKAMSSQYGIIPTIEHYICMVDLLGRAGQVEEALVMVEKMPFQPNLVIWLTMLAACRNWTNVEVGRHTFENVVRLDEKLSSAYVLMANTYADTHMVEECIKLR